MAETPGQTALDFPLQVKERLIEVQEAMNDEEAEPSGVLVDIQRVRTAAQALGPSMLPAAALVQINAAVEAMVAAKAAVDAAILAIP